VKLPLDRALAATHATPLDADAAPATLRVSTDTRSLEPGDTFVALRGEHFDGHDFVAEAATRGAAMLVVERAAARVPGVATMLVADTRAAYAALAGAARRLYRGRVAAITGSAGKTTTKDLLAQLLEARYGDRITSTPENENNEIGVSKLLLSASNDAHDVLVIEMGARHYGDIAALVEIARPDLGVLTNVGDAHLEIMGSRERLEETKWALFAGGARAVLNASDALSRRRAPSLAKAPHWFAANGATLDSYAGLDPLTIVAGDRRLVHRTHGRTLELAVDARLAGLHNRTNLAAAVAAALELDVPLEPLARRLPALRLPRGRYDRIAVSGGLQIIYDAYNANASATMAALDAFAAETATRRIAVLAGMAELGNESKDLHERVGAHAAGRVDVLLVHGEFSDELARGASRAGLAQQQIVHIANNAQAARWLREHVHPDDVVLLKGSRKYRLEEIVEELRT
jgi:UDP-N-acetylmuramoyl-tripeptide--D-alanyl-D-alanine ligase